MSNPFNDGGDTHAAAHTQSDEAAFELAQF
jgi:hypothetical protein